MDSDTAQEITTVDCPHCGKTMDVSELRPFSMAICPWCEGMARVRVEMGPYRIVGKVGKGGMSVVFRAEDLLLSRHVALKILNENYSSDESRMARFEQEARVMAKVQHPHIVKIYGVGRAQGYFYIAMELVEGMDMETRLNESGKMEEPYLLKIGIQVAEALKEAWKEGLIHRDIKPANILVDEKDHAKIVDFGLSLLQNEKDQDHEIWVTPFYASPEALMRENEDFRSDMYALGATLAHLIAGQIPISNLPKNASELREKKKTWQSLRKWCPEVSPLTCRIVDRLMRFEPEKRYGSYDELIADMKQSLAALYDKGQDWQTQRRSLRRESRRKIVRKCLLCLSGGVAALALAVWGIVSSMSSPRRDVPVAPVKPVVKEEARKVMSFDRIEKTYRLGEKLFREKDIPGALREFGKLAREKDCPLAISTWASIQSTLLSWASGSFPNIEDSFRLKEIHQQLAEMPEEKKRSLGLLETEMVMEQLLSNGKVKNRKILVGRLEISLLVGEFLQAWQDSRCSIAVGILEKLETISRRKGDEGGFAAEWLACLSAYKNDSSLWTSLKKLPENNSKDIDKKLEACEALSENPKLIKSPGSGFAGALCLYAKRLREEGEKARNRELAEQEEARRKLNREILERQNRQALMEEEEKKASLLRREEELTAAMRDKWEFGQAAAGFEELMKSGGSENRKRYKAKREMALQSLEFLESVCNDIPSLPAEKRIIKLSDGSTCLIEGGTGQTCRIHVNGTSRFLRWGLVPPQELLRLHRESISNARKSSLDIMKRHAGAISFLYLAGEKEKAEKAAEKLSATDVKFSRRWDEWMNAIRQ